MELNQTNFTETLLQGEEFSLQFKVTLAILYNILLFIGVLGNSFVVYLKLTKGVPRTITNNLIINLAICDLSMSLLCINFTYIPLLLGWWPFGLILCHLVNPAKAVTILGSAFTLVAMAGDRYTVILHPLRPRLRRGLATYLIIIIWSSSFFISIPILVQTTYFHEMVPDEEDNSTTIRAQCNEVWGDNRFRILYSLTLMILQYLLPLIVFIYTYTRIIFYMTVKQIPGEREFYRGVVLASAKKKAIKMMGMVVSVYSICWAPINFFIVAADFDMDLLLLSTYHDHIYAIVHCIAISHTVFNPFIYCVMDNNFRNSIICFLEKSSSFRRLFRNRHNLDSNSSLKQNQPPNTPLVNSKSGIKDLLMHPKVTRSLTKSSIGPVRNGSIKIQQSTPV